MDAQFQDNPIPGQQTLPGMAEILGFEAATLKPDQERFVWGYVLRKGSVSEAYKAVHPDTSTDQARKNGHKLLKKGDVWRRIEQVQQELKRRYTLTADDLHHYHAKVLTIGRDSFLSADGSMRPLSEIEPEALSILEFEQSKDSKGRVVTLFRVPTRHASAVELAKLMGAYAAEKSDVALSGEVAVTEFVRRIVE